MIFHLVFKYIFILNSFKNSKIQIRNPGLLVKPGQPARTGISRNRGNRPGFQSLVLLLHHYTRWPLMRWPSRIVSNRRCYKPCSYWQWTAVQFARGLVFGCRPSLIDQQAIRPRRLQQNCQHPCVNRDVLEACPWWMHAMQEPFSTTVWHATLY